MFEYYENTFLAPMTVKELYDIFKKNNIPDDARIMTDSGWECSNTDVTRVYYNPELNVVILAQDDYGKCYGKEPWILLKIQEARKFEPKNSLK